MPEQSCSGFDGLGSDEQGEGIDRDVVAIAHHDGGGLAALEDRGEQAMVTLAELGQIQAGERVALGVLERHAGEVEDVRLLEQPEERLRGQGRRRAHRHDDLADQSLEEAEFISGDLRGGGPLLDEHGAGFLAETQRTDPPEGFPPEIVGRLGLHPLERIDVQQ